MLDKVGNKQIKEELDALRPAAPEASAPSGSYSQYMDVEITAQSGTVYVTTDQNYPSAKDDPYTGPISLPRGQTTIYAVCIGENGLVSRMAVYTYIISHVVEEVTITDSSIDAEIRQLLQLGADETIYSNMLWELETFTVPQDASSCADLQWLSGLKTLIIDGCAFTDFAPLSALTGLQTLTVRNTTIEDSDLSFLAGMKELSNLTLSGCSVSTIADMAGTTSLRELDLSNNTVRNLSALSGMTALEKLDLSYNAVISLQDIQGLTNLRHLDLSYNSLATTAPVAALIELTYLDVSSNNLMQVHMKGLDTLTKLEHFAAAYNNLTDLSMLKNCVMLKTLDVSHNTLLNISVVGGLPLLEELDFSYNEVSRLPTFQTTCALRIIRGEHNLLTSLDNLSGLQNLTHIYMDYNAKLANINALRHCKALNTVNVYGTKVTDISVLAAAGILVNYTPKV